MYYIGIDFGHGETSVSRIPGYNGESISRVPLRITNREIEKKAISAIYRKNNSWHFVWRPSDVRRYTVREGFKGILSNLEPTQREAFAEFAKLIFNAILKNDPDLQYDSVTGEANFVICIANPTEWRRKDSNIPLQYLQFFRDECGIIPVTLCINESDAAFFTKYDEYSPDETVFVIDLGSSTIDFTTYHENRIVPDCCWGRNLGAHIIEDKIIDKVFESQQNVRMLEFINEARGNLGLENVEPNLSLIARMKKEDYFSPYDEDNNFEFGERITNFGIDNVPTRETVFNLNWTSEEFDQVIHDYKEQLRMALDDAAKKLQSYGISPTTILLSGGASRMYFVEVFTRNAFPEVLKIYRDNYPEWVVSDGAAKYIQAQQSALGDLQDLIRAIDYKSIYIDADITATQRATKALLPSVISKITGSSNLTGWEMLKEFCEFFFELNSANQRYVDLFNEAAKTLLKEKISKSIKDVIFNAFKVDVDMSDISLQYEFVVMNWQPEFWAPVEKDGEIDWGPGCKTVMQAIADSSGRFDFTWDKKREKSERVKIAEGCRERFSGRDPFGVHFDEQSLNDAVNAIRQQTLKIVEKLFHEKELFRTSFHE